MLAVALAIVGGFVAAVADAAFSGHVCGLLTTKQVAAANVTPPKCATEPIIKDKGATFLRRPVGWNRERRQPPPVYPH
jgi:hypothetical protein